MKARYLFVEVFPKMVVASVDPVLYLQKKTGKCQRVSYDLST